MTTEELSSVSNLRQVEIWSSMTSVHSHTTVYKLSFLSLPFSSDFFSN